MKICELKKIITLYTYEKMKNIIDFDKNKINKNKFYYYKNYSCSKDENEEFEKLIELNLVNKDIEDNRIIYHLTDKGISFINNVENVEIKKLKW